MGPPCGKTITMERITVIVFFVLSLSYSSEASFSAEQASVNEPWPAYRNDCFIAFLEENIGEGKQLLYQQVDEEASRGLNVTRMFEFKNIEPGFVFMGDKDSVEKVFSRVFFVHVYMFQVTPLFKRGSSRYSNPIIWFCYLWLNLLHARVHVRMDIRQYLIM